MIPLAVLLYSVLVLPLLGSFFYSTDKQLDRLALSMAGLAVALWIIAVSAKSISNRSARLAVSMLLTELVAAFQISRLLSFYFQGESFNARFFFHFNLNTLAEAGGAYLLLISLAVLFLAVVAIIGKKLFGSMDVSGDHRRLRGIAAFLVISLPALAVIEPDLLALSKQRLATALSAAAPLSADTVAWQELRLNQAALSATASTVLPGKNLVFIYLESLERIYTDDAVFPDLTPNIERLAAEALEFTGLTQTAGTDWTVGGMVASQCGTPLLYPLGPSGNDILQNGFLNRAVCLGDVLTRAGYRQVFLGGASSAFAGKGSFLRSHGYDEVNGKTELVGFLDDPSYISGWGLYDDTLFDIAANKYAELAAAGPPFNLTILTLDTHHPSGAASRSCPQYQRIDNSMLDAVHCSDFLLGRFIDRIDDSPAWAATVVVLLSDHLAMRNVAQRYYPPDYDRKLLFAVLNAGNKGRIETLGSHMDIAPTLLDLMGTEHEVSFLAGTSLVANERSTSSEAILISTRRSDAIKFINTNLLTDRSAGIICDGSSLATFDDKQLRIGGREVLLDIDGASLPADALRSSHVLFALLSESGSLRSTMTVNVANLAHVLYQFEGETFLLVGPGPRLPDMLGLDANRAAIAVILGNLRSETLYLGGAEGLQTLDIGIAGCRDLLETVRRGVGATRQDLLHTICPAKENSSSYLDSETGYLHLDRIAHNNSWYKAVLSPQIDGGFALRELAYLGTIAPESGMERCHAYFGNSELIVPALRGGQATAMRMRLIPGRDWEFTVLETR